MQTASDLLSPGKLSPPSLPAALQACTSITSQVMDATCWDAFAGSPPSCSQDCLDLVGPISVDCQAELLQWELQLNQFLAAYQGTQLWYW